MMEMVGIFDPADAVEGPAQGGDFGPEDGFMPKLLVIRRMKFSSSVNIA